LEGSDPGDAQNEHIIQAGNMLEPFEAKEFLSQENITSNSLKGKYVFIDFWGTGCRGCVAAMPKLNEIYKKIDKTQVAFVGISDDGPVALRKGIKIPDSVPANTI
jgi:thiol-disulfide isomerase/thioredoxin